MFYSMLQQFLVPLLPKSFLFLFYLLRTLSEMFLAISAINEHVLYQMDLMRKTSLPAAPSNLMRKTSLPANTK